MGYTNRMSYAQAVPFTDLVETRAVVRPRPARVALPVWLTGEHPEACLTKLLHSPLGIYVVQTETSNDSIRVTLDIAPEDFDFTLHTLVATLPEATVGHIAHRSGMKVQ